MPDGFSEEGTGIYHGVTGGVSSGARDDPGVLEYPCVLVVCDLGLFSSRYS